ncbi:hypothetical protein D1872_292550 [compost metagenome]
MLKPQHEFRRQLEPLQQLLIPVKGGIGIDQSRPPKGHDRRCARRMVDPGDACRRIDRSAVIAASRFQDLTGLSFLRPGIVYSHQFFVHPAHFPHV